MNQERLLKVLLAPHVSEKSAGVAESGSQVVFKVAADATKPEIKGAVEMLFNVKVKSVNVSNVKGKRKRFGARFGVRSDWKKAYVALEAGQEIDFLGGQ
ncbi:LSU ribosomal protein L23P [Plasticicumulans lactativorans]|uniref:Large ribosomal subunit protein uL23 n=1 Tax=Plasticicumulans lactativorans TaxID=1133106 RepID=A0A4R2L8B9_9GAMM|nr:50S ribosomal protein L23 [Plasticicumulans lactativorans]TCO82282.1 LSU ribosomal protein L23P [Plasticicumulans lactativorans]